MAVFGSESGAVNAALPQVVFVDDDEAIRRLVASVLEDLPIVLRCCASVAEARAALREQPAQLVITDLMLPVETGFDLLESFVAEPALRAGARLAVFSAGLNSATRARLSGLDVWRELAKPVSLQALEDCVNDALALAPCAAPAAPGATTMRTGDELLAHEERAIATQFGGDAALYLAFRSQVQVQLSRDIREGEHMLTQHDWPALHRLAHSLKGVLLLLGDEPGAGLARELESTAAAVAEAAKNMAANAAAADAGACLQGWQALAGHLNSHALKRNQIQSD